MALIEVEDRTELAQALAAGARKVRLDDFTLADMQRACSLNAGRAVLEASGGVDRISVCTLTKDLRALDLSLHIDG